MSTIDKIVKGMADTHGMFSPREIGHMAGVAESTVRRWLPKLIFKHRYVRHTSYTGLYVLTPEGQAHAATLVEEKAA